MSICARQSWIFAAVMGVLVLALSTASVGVVAGLFLGLVTAGLLGALLVGLFCQGTDDDEDWPETADSMPETGTQRAASIRRDDAPVAHAPISRPVRPQGMTGAPKGASDDAVKAVTFTEGGAGKAARARRGKTKAAVLADASETAHSGSVGTGEPT